MILRFILWISSACSAVFGCFCVTQLSPVTPIPSEQFGCVTCRKLFGFSGLMVSVTRVTRVTLVFSGGWVAVFNLPFQSAPVRHYLAQGDPGGRRTTASSLCAV